MTARPGPRLGPGGPLLGQSGPGPALRVCPSTILTTLGLGSLVFVGWFGSMAALTFLVTGLVLWARQPARAVSDVLRYWPIHAIAGWCLLSTFWSNEPGVTLRAAVQLGLTGLIAVAMATRLSPRAFVLSAFWAFGAAAMASLLFGRVRADGAGWIGIFGSKNEFAFAMSALTLLGFALLLDRRGGRSRLLGLAAVALGAFLLVMGQSAGAIVSTGAAGALGLALVSLRRLDSTARMVALVMILLGTVAVALVAVAYQAQLATAFLDTTGKDVTLTGRTELWAEALAEIRLHPLLGQGYQAFWVHGNPVAEAMWAEFGIATRMGFNFHNTWISNAVDIGLLGVGIELAVFGATLVVVGRWVLKAQTAASLFFAMFTVRQAAISLVEVVAYNNFSVNTILMLVALVYGLRVQAEAARRPRPLTRSAPPMRAAGGPTGSGRAWPG